MVNDTITVLIGTGFLILAIILTVWGIKDYYKRKNNKKINEMLMNSDNTISIDEAIKRTQEKPEFDQDYDDTTREEVLEDGNDNSTTTNNK